MICGLDGMSGCYDASSLKKCGFEILLGPGKTEDHYLSYHIKYKVFPGTPNLHIVNLCM